MNTKQIEYILAIEHEKNIQKAAEKVFITQSALSQQLKLLEDELGCKLFQRTPKGLVITNAGKIYCNNAKEVMRIKENTYREIKTHRKEEKKKCNIGVSFYDGMVKLMENAKLLESEFPFSFSFSEENPQQLIKLLNKNKLDLAIVSLRGPSLLHNQYELLRKEEVLLASPVNTLSYNAEGIGPEMLEGMNIILSKPGSTIRLMQEDFLQPIKSKYSVILETNNISVVLDSVKHGKGIGFMPESLIANKIKDAQFFHLRPRKFRYQVIIYKDETSITLIKKLKDILI